MAQLSEEYEMRTFADDGGKPSKGGEVRIGGRENYLNDGMGLATVYTGSDNLALIQQREAMDPMERKVQMSFRRVDLLCTRMGLPTKVCNKPTVALRNWKYASYT